MQTLIHAMRLAALIGVSGSGAAGTAYAQVVTPSGTSDPTLALAGDGAINAAPNQWFTGSLEAPSPALPKAGMLALEPYFVLQSGTGAYGDNGTHHSVTSDTDTFESLLVIKYGLTNRLTIEALPSISHSWARHMSTGGASFGDLPVELEYRVTDGNFRNGAPSVTLVAGLTAPTGAYNRLSRVLDGVGSGAWTAKQGVTVQSLFDTWQNHPVRLRAWAEAFEPLDDPSVSNVSTYGTASGFQGHIRPGASGQIGVAGGYALTQRWVLALDVDYTFSAGSHLRGVDGDSRIVDSQSSTQTSFALAPAIEYNWSAKGGLIFGMEFSAAGRNTPSYIAPQIAIAMSF